MENLQKHVQNSGEIAQIELDPQVAGANVKTHHPDEELKDILKGREETGITPAKESTFIDHNISAESLRQIEASDKRLPSSEAKKWNLLFKFKKQEQGGKNV